ncbi:MAG: hypothetical protein NT062_38490 [Proteobacteria bacterium]|nr:hypothetical protein [Pseudomonadota bacterium]
MTASSDIVRVGIAMVVTIAALHATPAAADDLRDRSIGHVITAPTAWLPPGGVTATTGLDHHGGTMLSGTISIGPFASVELGGDSEVRICHGCGDTRPDAIWLGRATFKLGASQDQWFVGQPALAFGVRTTFAGKHDTRVAEAFVVASRDLGPIRLHVGASASDGRDERTTAPRRSLRDELRALRPLGGFEWTPGQYPKTSLMGDIAWVPLVEDDAVSARYVTSFAVRYQAFAWSSIELGMNYREAEEIGDSTFFVRVNASARRAR